MFHSGFNVAGFTNNWYLTRQDQTLDCADRTGMLTVYATIWSDNPPGTTAMHSCPDNACPALVFLPQGRYSRYGDPIEICYTEGASLGQMSNQWSLLYHRGHVGWTHRHWLAHSVNGTDHC